MKKSHQKILAAIALIGLAAFGYHKYTQNSKIKSNSEKEISTTYEVDHGNGNITKYSKEAGKYFKQLTGPTIRAKKVEISEKEYTSQYAN